MGEMRHVFFFLSLDNNAKFWFLGLRFFIFFNVILGF
jgi:hypothetical protein